MSEPRRRAGGRNRQPLARVLVIDNDPRVGEDLKDLLEPPYQVSVVVGNGQSLLDHTLAVARDFRPHVAVVDLRLLSEETDERSGFQLLEPLRSAHCILYSAYLSPEVIREAAHKHQVEDWVSKAEDPERLLEVIDDAACRTSYAFRTTNDRCAGLIIQRPETWSSGSIASTILKGNRTPRGIVDDVLCQLFSQARDLRLETVVGDIRSAPAASRGQSVVIKVTPDDLEPLVLKLGLATELEREELNYAQHIDNRLVGRFYAERVKGVRFWDVGGVVYRFMGSSQQSLPSFREYYQSQTDAEAILKPLQHFFTEVWSRHYRHPRGTGQHSLFELYDQSLNLKRHLKVLRKHSPSPRLKEQLADYRDPVDWVGDRAGYSRINSTEIAVTHGDFHADNLFVDTEHAWAIDFGRTGYGHILRDFVELEVDIVTRLLPQTDNDLAGCRNLCIALTGPTELRETIAETTTAGFNEETRKCISVVEALRKLAYDVTHCADFRGHLWGVLLDALFVASLKTAGASQRERAYLLAAVAASRLENWSNLRRGQPAASGVAVQ